MKLQLRYDLCNEEKEHYVDTQELAEIDLGRIQKEAVANEHKCSRNEPHNLFHTGGPIEASLEASVTLHFKVGSQSEDDESTEW